MFLPVFIALLSAAAAVNSDEAAVKWHYIGCYLSVNGNDALQHRAHKGAKLTQHFCRDICFARSFAHFGLRAGSECFCGNTVTESLKLPDKKCSWKCAGDLNTACGSDLGMMVFSFGDKAAPPQVPSSAPPQVPSKAPPEVPSKAPPQVPSKAPPQVPSKAPPQAQIAPKSSLKLVQLSGCSQSSDFIADTKCDKAYDGNKKASALDWSLSHTDEKSPGWWKALTIVPAHIKEIRIYNRQDCCAERLTDFYISVDGAICASYRSSETFLVKTFPCDAIGQEVTIQSNKPYLTLAEVEVFAESEYVHFKSCTQSSDYQDVTKCDKAYDGNKKASALDWSLSHTDEKSPGWWKAHTIVSAHIKEIRIYNRQDCCAERLTDFYISVDGDLCASYRSSETFLVKTFPCDAIGQEVTIQSNKPYLTLVEVEVFAASELVQLSGCSQSSDFHADTKCDKAYDGNKKASVLDWSLSHTDEKSPGWWKAHTIVPAHIKEIRIYNREDCCAERLTDFYISVDGAICASYRSSETFLVKTFPCDAIGQEVTIQSNKPYLTLAEVEVFATRVKECYKKHTPFVGSGRFTQSGKPCQSWTVTECHKDTDGVSCHVPNSAVRYARITGNTCRNPVAVMEEKPWCYTTTATRWEFCDLPEC